MKGRSPTGSTVHPNSPVQESRLSIQFRPRSMLTAYTKKKKRKEKPDYCSLLTAASSCEKRRRRWSYFLSPRETHYPRMVVACVILPHSWSWLSTVSPLSHVLSGARIDTCANQKRQEMKSDLHCSVGTAAAGDRETVI